MITIDGRNIRALPLGGGEIVTLLISEDERCDIPIRLSVSDTNALIALLQEATGGGRYRAGKVP